MIWKKILRIVPDFWKTTLQGNQFSELCKLSNQEPNGILGISVYESPKKSIIISALLPMLLLLRICTSMKFLRQLGLYLRMMDVLKKMSKVYSDGFIWNWLPFSGYQYAELPDIEVYPICGGQPAHGHSEVWIAIKEEDR